jgi:hypothetical protein
MLVESSSADRKSITFMGFVLFTYGVTLCLKSTLKESNFAIITLEDG